MGRIGTDVSDYVLQTLGETSRTVSYTVPSGSARKILLAVMQNGSSANIAAATGVTIGGNAMTAVTGTAVSAGSTLLVHSQMWMIDEASIPSTGAKDVVVSFASAATVREAWLYVMAIENIAQGQPSASDADAATSGTTITSTISPTQNAYVLGCHVANVSGTKSWSGEMTSELYDNAQSAVAGVEYEQAAGSETSYTATSASTITRAARSAAWWAVAYKLPTTTGAFTLTGIAATLSRTRKLVADTGAFTLSAAATGLLAQRRLTADVGAFALTGIAAGLAPQRMIAAGVGSFVLTGADALLLAQKRMDATTGSFALTGPAASLLVQRRIAGDTGSFSLSGAAAALLAGRLLTAASGSFAWSGPAVTLSRTRTLIADCGVFVLVGYAAQLGAANTLQAESGAFALSGSATGLLAQRRLTAAVGSFALTGQAAALVRAARISAQAGDFALGAAAAALLAGRLLTAAPGSFALTAAAVNLAVLRKVLAQTGVFVLTGSATALQGPARGRYRLATGFALFKLKAGAANMTLRPGKW